ncbi:MAG: glycoside hydrolase family 28 protein [Candidatus Hydrogenedentes bacterium]|nr:glycoside hydrolase family 28 protein [Candidatus Hydrogenedentota bacterium]
MLRTATLLAVLILQAVSPPASALYDVKAHGATGDGATSDTAAIQAAMDACTQAGGGTVYFPPGAYLTGSLHLRSRVTLWLDNGATLLGSESKEDYDRYEELGFENDADGETTYFHFALLWGEDVEHIAIMGQGTIDSNRFGRGGPKAIALKRCRHVSIRDITIQNIPNYAISLLGTDYVNIDGVTILRGFADGIDPDASRNVRISNCHIETVDDAIVPKASFSLGERRSTENITVTNCYLATECSGFKLGTESGGDFKRIAVSNCIVTALPERRPPRGGICIESVDGANIDGVVVNNISMIDVRMPVFVRLGNRGRDMETSVPGSLRNVIVSNITATGASLACSIAGVPGHAIEGVTLSNLRVEYRGGASYLPEAEMPEQEADYPDPEMYDYQPVYALYARHVRDLVLTDVDFTYRDNYWRIATTDNRKVRWHTEAGIPDPSEAGNTGPAAAFDDVARLRINGFAAQPPANYPMLRFINVRDAQLRGCAAETGAGVFLEVQGSESNRIVLTDSQLEGVAAVKAAADVPSDAVQLLPNAN